MHVLYQLHGLGNLFQVYNVIINKTSDDDENLFYLFQNMVMM